VAAEVVRELIRAASKGLPSTVIWWRTSYQTYDAALHMYLAQCKAESNPVLPSLGQRARTSTSPFVV
jgi:hypothetical protein